MEAGCSLSGNKSPGPDWATGVTLTHGKGKDDWEHHDAAPGLVPGRLWSGTIEGIKSSLQATAEKRTLNTAVCRKAPICEAGRHNHAGP